MAKRRRGGGGLLERHKKILDDLVRDLDTPTLAFLQYDDLGESVQAKLRAVKDTETLHSDVDRYLADLSLKRRMEEDPFAVAARPRPRPATPMPLPDPFVAKAAEFLSAIGRSESKSMQEIASTMGMKDRPLPDRMAAFRRRLSESGVGILDLVGLDAVGLWRFILWVQENAVFPALLDWIGTVEGMARLVEFYQEHAPRPAVPPAAVKESEILPGGKGDGHKPEEFDPEQYAMGLAVELEHTPDVDTASEIVTDHLTEAKDEGRPDYYTRLLRDVEGGATAKVGKYTYKGRSSEGPDRWQEVHGVGKVLHLWDAPDDFGWSRPVWVKRTPEWSDKVGQYEAGRIAEDAAPERIGVFSTEHAAIRAAVKWMAGVPKPVEATTPTTVRVTTTASRLHAPLADLIADYKARGFDEKESWNALIKDRGLRPDVDFKEMRSIYASVTPKLLEETQEVSFHPTHLDTVTGKKVQITRSETGRLDIVWEFGMTGSQHESGEPGRFVPLEPETPVADVPERTPFAEEPTGGFLDVTEFGDYGSAIGNLEALGWVYTAASWAGTPHGGPPDKPSEVRFEFHKWLGKKVGIGRLFANENGTYSFFASEGWLGKALKEMEKHGSRLYPPDEEKIRKKTARIREPIEGELLRSEEQVEEMAVSFLERLPAGEAATTNPKVLVVRFIGWVERQAATGADGETPWPALAAALRQEKVKRALYGIVLRWVEQHRSAAPPVEAPKPAVKPGKEPLQKAGIAVVRFGEILLAHPTNARWWATYSIPKGHPDEGETNLLPVALREFREETGMELSPHRAKLEGPFTVEHADAKGHVKVVLNYWILDASDLDMPDKLPREQLQLAEVDWAGFVSIEEAKRRMVAYQQPILDHVPHAQAEAGEGTFEEGSHSAVSELISVRLEGSKAWATAVVAMIRTRAAVWGSFLAEHGWGGFRLARIAWDKAGGRLELAWEHVSIPTAEFRLSVSSKPPAFATYAVWPVLAGWDGKSSTTARPKRERTLSIDKDHPTLASVFEPPEVVNVEWLSDLARKTGGTPGGAPKWSVEEPRWVAGRMEMEHLPEKQRMALQDVLTRLQGRGLPVAHVRLRPDKTVVVVFTDPKEGEGKHALILSERGAVEPHHGFLPPVTPTEQDILVTVPGTFGAVERLSVCYACEHGEGEHVAGCVECAIESACQPCLPAGWDVEPEGGKWVVRDTSGVRAGRGQTECEARRQAQARLAEVVVERLKAPTLRNLPVEVGVQFGPGLTQEQTNKLFEAEKILRSLGVKFDTGFRFSDGTRHWEWDWSLSGPVQVTLKSGQEAKVCSVRE